MDLFVESAAVFARACREVMSEAEEPTTLERIVEKAVETIRGCDAASITVRSKGDQFATIASSDPVATACDNLQYKLKIGPCVHAVWAEEAYLVPDTRDDGLFAGWSRQVAATYGIRSVLSIRLFHDSAVYGSLNFYSTAAHAFPPDDVDVALVFTTHAASALRSARQIAGLSKAMQTRHLIGAAQGILMMRYGLTMERAFDVLKRVSNHTNVPVREVAQHVVDTGALPISTEEDDTRSTADEDATRPHGVEPLILLSDPPAP